MAIKGFKQKPIETLCANGEDYNLLTGEDKEAIIYRVKITGGEKFLKEIRG